ncbi:hypothetical protein [Polyangium aurulentum]|uniref:hypothetical protein n=1 Tax=Polyangium aurulentum TaxID=2567896 RepID=UPI0010AE14E7|nr:hypothetical protein [Polyangium aurulentum]UQA60911.1 hypothetical protein E8A73_010685 [Polyangium aurulentum]
MNSVRSYCVVLAGICVVATGCGAADGENPFDGDAFDVSFETMNDPPPVGPNGDSGKCLKNTDVHYILRKMSQQKLNFANGSLENSVAYLGDCAHIVRSAIKCALKPEQFVTDPVTGEIYKGWWGLADTWETLPLDTEGQRWVTACMIQKLNYYGATVPILLEGDNTPINVNATLDPQYPFDESTAFGNYFLPEPALYACWESDLAVQCKSTPGGAEDDLEARVCDDNNTNCGIQMIGDCSLQCQQSGPYWVCTRGGVTYEETIRVQLQTYAGKHCPSP